MLNVALEIVNVSMKFNLGSEKISSLKEYIIKVVQGKLYFEDFWALKNVSFSVNKGEIFGIIGLNGAGKSTLLKVISAVLRPTQGKVEIGGSIAPLIELGAGFDMDLTARENIFLNGAVLGYSQKYMSEKMDEIIEFAELRDFIDVPLKNYSSGMYARLGFSIATMVEPDILIVDEILSVGDIHFKQKCEDRIEGILKKGCTVILVSHDLNQVEKLCDRVLWLEKGNVREIGDSKEVCKRFKVENEG
jgi:ABC-2 type transport system ATP-binding protein